MTDVHCHVPRPGKARQFVIGEDFIGIHPWETLRTGSVPDKTGSVPNDELLKMAGLLSADKKLGVGEIGLDRLKNRDISSVMRETFLAQLELAARPPPPKLPPPKPPPKLLPPPKPRPPQTLENIIREYSLYPKV